MDDQVVEVVTSPTPTEPHLLRFPMKRSRWCWWWSGFAPCRVPGGDLGHSGRAERLRSCLAGLASLLPPKYAHLKLSSQGKTPIRTSNNPVVLFSEEELLFSKVSLRLPSLSWVGSACPEEPVADIRAGS